MWRQLYFSGVESFPVAVLAGVSIGAVVVILAQSTFGQTSANAIRLLTYAVAQEVGPVVVSFLLIMRSISAMAAEIAGMKVSGELANLMRWGISPTVYLIVPRVAAASISAVLLFIFFSLSAALSGALSTQQMNPLAELVEVARAMPVELVAVGLLKCLLFGGMTAFTACVFGASANADITEVARISSRAVLWSVLQVLVLDAVFVLIFA